MDCPYKECTHSDECAILDITKKIPKKMDSCSYSKKKKAEHKTPAKKEP